MMMMMMDKRRDDDNDDDGKITTISRLGSEYIQNVKGREQKRQDTKGRNRQEEEKDQWSQIRDADEFT